MPSSGDWKIPASVQPRSDQCAFDLDQALTCVVSLRATVPEDAFTAETLGTERAGNGVVIRDDGLILTIGYLVTEAEAVWLMSVDGRAFPGHVLGFDHATGFGLVQALARLDLPAMPLGRSAEAGVGERVVVGGAGGRHRSVAARIVAREEFAGYWEYVLDEAIFVAPAHPHWGGTALIGARGELLGIGSLQVQQETGGGPARNVNMVVPIDLLPPILDDLLRFGRVDRPARPWLGLYAAEVENRVVVIGLAKGGPAQRAGVRTGDVVVAVAGEEPADLAGLFRRVWSLGEAGVEVPLRLYRNGRTLDMSLTSTDRARLLKAPRLH